MKLMKKVLALIMALTIVLSMAVSASADTITINGAVAEAKYNGYRILNLSAGLKKPGCHEDEADHEASCYNLAYSVNPTYQGVLETVTGKTTDTDIRNYIGAMIKDSDEIRAFADQVYAEIQKAGIAPEAVALEKDGKTQMVDIAQGYWLIEEVYITDTDPDSDYEKDHSLVMLTTMGIRDISVNTKRDNVTLTKKVYHDDAASWEIVSDDQIGDIVSFHTESHVPDTDGFEEMFTYVIHDTMSTGLTSNVVTNNTNGDVKVTINSVSGDELPSKYYKVYAGTDANGVVLGQYTDDSGTKVKHFNCDAGCHFHVIFDIKAALNDKAIDDDDTLYTTYSAVLNESAQVFQTAEERENNKAHVEYSNNPYDETETTHTPDSIVYEYTFKLNVLKTDATTGSEIQNAKFVLSKDGTTQGNTIDADGSGTIEASEKDNLYKFIKHENTYRIVSEDRILSAEEENAGKTLTYVIEAGAPVIQGLDDGTDYYLYEIKAPDGYNPTYAPTRIKLFVEYNPDGSVKEGFPKIQINSKEQSSTLQVTIENNTGTVMPSTGGIGTTLFYTIGGILVAAALVLLVTKKRMAA